MLCLLSDDCVEFELHASYFLYGKDVMQIIDLEHVPASVGYDHNDAVVDDQYLHGVSTFVRGGLSREHLSWNICPGFTTAQSTVPSAQSPVPRAQCPVPRAQFG